MAASRQARVRKPPKGIIMMVAPNSSGKMRMPAAEPSATARKVPSTISKTPAPKVPEPSSSRMTHMQMSTSV